MRLRYPHSLIHNVPLFSSSSKLATMTTQLFSRSTLFPDLRNSLSPERHRFNPRRAFFTVFCSKPAPRNRPSPLTTNGYSRSSHASVPRPVYLENPEEESMKEMHFNALKRKLKALGMDTGICVPGQYNHLLCPMCEGGESGEKSLSLFIAHDGGSAVWVCFRGKCGWKGSTQGLAGSHSLSTTMSAVPQVKKIREITEKELQLEPLCPELLGYFAERLISKETLVRNAVMQRKYDDQIVIAFTYRRNGALISCKYRDIKKNFWQILSESLVIY